MRAAGAVLVTGGSGFLGAAVLRALRHAGYRVQTLQRHMPDPAGEAVHYTGDIRNPADVACALTGVSDVIHTAGLAHVFTPSSSAPFREVNEAGSEVVARAAVAAGVRHLVHVSSVSVYGGCDAGGREADPCLPSGPYAESKAAAEARVRAAVEGSETRVTILRLATLYGRGDRGNLQRLVNSISSGRFIWIGDGSNRKSLIHVDDAARACVLALEASTPGVEIFNVSAPAVSMKDVVEAIAEAVGRRPPRWRIPAPAARAAGAVAAATLGTRGRAVRGTLARWLADDVYPGDLFARRFDFKPLMELRDGIRDQAADGRAERRGGE